MRKTVIFLLVGFVALGWAAGVTATTADFQGNCSGVLPTFCVFDASRTSSSGSGTSCAPATVVQTFWDFGNGQSQFTANQHVLVGTQYATRDLFTVKLVVFCSDGTTATKVHCVNTTQVGVIGCLITPSGTWQP